MTEGLAVSATAIMTLATVAGAQVWRINAFDLGSADAVVVGTVSASPPQVVDLACKTGEAYEQGPLPAEKFGVFTLTNVIALKGSAGETIRVVADAPSPSGGASPKVLPLGRRVLVILQSPRNGWFAHGRTMYGTSEYYFAATPDAVFAVFIAESGDYAVVADPPGGFRPKGDFLAYDAARILAVPVPGLKQPVVERLRPIMDVTALDRLQKGTESAATYACTKEIFGPEPAGFFAKEILPSLPSPATNVERLRMLDLAGAWGDSHVAADLADLVLRMGVPATEDERNAAASAAHAATGFPGGLDAAARLLTSPEPRVLVAVVRSIRTRSLPRTPLLLLLALLDRQEPDVLREVMESLAWMYHEMSHQPELRRDLNGFEAGSTNAERLQYWKARRAELLAGKT